MRIPSKLIHGLCCAFVLVAAMGTCLAQTGGLTVQVLDLTDESPLPGATVTLTSNQGLLAPTAILTDSEGRVAFPVLRVGSGYSVQVEMPGFAIYRVPAIRIQTGKAEPLVVGLASEIRESVRVVANSSVIDLDQQERTTKFDNEFLENLPVPGRFYQNVLTLAPGVKDADKDGNPNVHGARSRDFRAVVGGVSNTDPLTGEWLSYVNAESIEEMEVITASAGVEFGRASGGFARVLQKQGSNDFEGVFNFIYRSSKVGGQGSAPDDVQPSPDFEWIQPSIQVSGPIVRDKLWFRASHESIDREQPFIFLNRLDISRREQRMNSDQITWQVSPRNKLAFQFQSDPLTQTNFGLSARVPTESTQVLDRGGETYTVTWTAPQSPRLLVESLVAYQDHQQSLVPQVAGVPQDCIVFGISGTRIDSLNSAGCLNTDTGQRSGSSPETTRDQRQRFTFRTMATVYRGRFLGTSHRLKFGLEVENERYYRELDRRPDMTFFQEREENSLDGQPSLIPTGIGTVRVALPPDSNARATGVSWGLFVEDQITPLDGLSVTMGLRYDREEIDSGGLDAFDPRREAQFFEELLADGNDPASAARQAFTGIPNGDELQLILEDVLEIGNFTSVQLGSAVQNAAFAQNKRRADDIAIRNGNLSPRLAVAWDPWRDGKTKISLSAGRYYDKIFLAVPLIELEPPEVALTFEALRQADGRYLETGRLGSFAPVVTASLVDRNLRTPYQDEFTVGIEREIFPETSLSLSYVRRKFRDLLQDEDINHLTGDKGACRRPLFAGDGVVEVSEDVGDSLNDPYTGELYIDQQPGNGDGRIDDCTGVLLRDPQNPDNISERPDGLPDLYVQNPYWGQLLLVGNFNETDYEAYVVELTRRMFRSWQMSGSYTWSEAQGNAEDFNQIIGNERNLFNDEVGFLSYDQRHVVSISAMSLTPWGFNFGGTVRWESGLPYSITESQLTVFGRPPELLNVADRDLRFRLRYPTRQRNDQRNPSFWTFDLKMVKEFQLGRSTRMQLNAEVFNLFGDDTRFLEERINSRNNGGTRFGREIQLGAKFSF